MSLDIPEDTLDKGAEWRRRRVSASTGWAALQVRQTVASKKTEGDGVIRGVCLVTHRKVGMCPGDCGRLQAGAAPRVLNCGRRGPLLWYQMPNESA
jgi:hypothetical protein